MAKSTVAQNIYASVRAKHPDWTQTRVYAVTKNILAQRTAEETAKTNARAEQPVQ